MFKQREKENEKNPEYIDKVDDYEKAINYSKIPRIPWKEVLGCTLQNYIKNKKDDNLTKEDLFDNIMKEVDRKDKEDDTFWREWEYEKVEQNVNIGISCNKSLMKVFEVENNIDEEE